MGTGSAVGSRYSRSVTSCARRSDTIDRRDDITGSMTALATIRHRLGRDRPRAHPGCGMGMTYRFDRFTLDTGTRQLLGDGDEIHISPKAFDLLRCLVENRSRAMSRDELQSIVRSEEHTSEFQSLRHLVCRLLLEKKKQKNINVTQDR